MLHHGFSCGHDLTFHLTNWYDAAQQWRHGTLYPRWAQSPNFTAGEPRFIFYPPASWMLGAALVAITGWKFAPFVYIVLVLCAAAAAMYRLARLALMPAAALAAALVYMANPYMLFVIYTRSAYSELLAAAILPLLFLAVLRPRVHIALVAEASAALWLTNAPAAVIGMYSLLALAILSAWRHGSLPNLLRAATGAVLGFFIAAIYLWPAIFEQPRVQIARVKDAAYDFHRSFLFGHTGDPLHDAVLRNASSIAVILFAAIAACTLVVYLRRRHWHTLQKRVFFTLAIFSAVALLLMLPVSAFAWQHLPKLAFLQFPWRWLLAVAIVDAVLSGALVGAPTLRRRIPVGLAIVYSLAAVAVFSHRDFQTCDAQDTPQSVIAQLRSGAGVEGTDEYTPVKADPDDLQSAAPQVWFYTPDGKVKPGDHRELPVHAQVNNWSATHKSFSVDLPQPATAILQLMDYTAWQLRVNGQPTAKAAPASSGQIQIALPAGHSEVQVDFVRTGDRLMGDLLSFVALLVLAIITWRERKHHLHSR